VSSSRSEIRTVSWPQYGFKRQFDRDLHPPGVAQAFTPPRLIPALSPDLGREHEPEVTRTFPSEVLARQRLLPPRRVFTLDDVLRDSRSFQPTYTFADCSYRGRAVPPN